MNISIKMLKIVTVILWLIIVFFSITAVFSVMNMGITIGQVEMLPSSRGLTFSLPFTISNGGYYEIADLNVTTRVTDPDGALVDVSNTIIPSIPQGSNITASHDVSIDLDNILSLNRESLLLEDGDFNVQVFAGLDFARAVPVQLSTNTTIPWGAPFADLSIGSFSVSSFNLTHVEATIPISFENHAILSIAGTLIVEVYSNSQQRVATGTTFINVPSGSGYSNGVSVYARQQDLTTLTGTGTLHMVFETPMFTVEWDEPYG